MVYARANSAGRDERPAQRPEEVTAMNRSMARAALVLALGSTGCPGDKGPAIKPCCDQPKIPAGVTPFVVVGDDVTGTSDSERVIMQAGLSRAAKRDEIYPVLKTLYIHAMKRGPFEPIHFVATLYATEAAARTGGDQAVVGRIVREQSDIAPKCENLVRYDFTEQAARAFAAATGHADDDDPRDTCRLGEKKIVARADDKFTHRPSYKIDAARHAMELTYPYLDLGKDEYLEKLKFSSAMRDWIEEVNLFFGKVDDLQELTFIGVSNDEPVVKITVTRPQFQTVLAGLQEAVASHANVTFANLGMHRKDDKGAAKEQDSFQSKTYRATLAKLPKDQVSVSSKLK
jgi:hypothetical protein